MIRETAKHGLDGVGSTPRLSNNNCICNYDGQIVTITPDYLSQMGSVDSVCGRGRADWYDNGNGRYTYGRDHINT